ncbi:fimbria/pilus outer membrane usher protein [Hephaestia mangrovi]|uniref:fimbria/pilus outer membrane usher protein n=1 Tax=Hephaestia mangrovi TaxID=2873268 RepID=UPI001CA62D72|nr:fimbria/pilus outer membrane usher protein [Hephaestia mangrovi]MBY8826592.1 fimbria/pilus outer membrane usher protein [Hephaestia mangrovi]
MRRWGVALAGVSTLALAGRADAFVSNAAAPPPMTMPSGLSTQQGRLNTTGRDIPLGGPLNDNGFILGDISYTLKADDTIVIDAQALVTLLKQALAPATWQQIATTIGNRQTITAQELGALGVPVTYDPATFGLKLTIRAADRPTKTISLTGGYEPVTGKLETPAGFSAYLTAFANEDYVHRGADTGFQNPNILLDGAARMDGVVLESEATVQDRFARQSTRLVYDDIAHTERFSLGDLEPISRGFSGASPVAGVSVSRVYSDLKPQLNIQPRGQQSFTLIRSSTVETIVNGQVVQQTRLGPGTYSLRDFPFAQGSNNVNLVIRDDSGRVDTINFSIDFDRNLLAKGLTEFGLYAGVRAPYTLGGRKYTGTPMAEGFYRHGFTDQFTAGGNFQANSHGVVAGGEVVMATSIGTISTNLAASDIRHLGTGFALNVGYELTFGTESNHVRSLTASVQTMSRQFGTPDIPYADNPYKLQVGATYSQNIGRDQYVSLDSYYAFARGSVHDQASFRLTYGWRATTRTLITAEAIYDNRGIGSDYGFRLSIMRRFGRESTAEAEVDTRDGRARLSYEASHGTGVGSYDASASIDRTDQAVAVNANLTSIQNRAELSVAHTTSFSSDGGAITDQRTSARIATSIAFADGHLALARPIYDSFAMVVPHRTLDGAPVYIDPNDKHYLARSGAYGPAVAPELSAYSPRVLTYDVPKAPIGYDIGSGAAQFMPPYRAGYVLEVGSDYSVTYTGQLLQPDGTPLSLKAGEVTEVSRPGRAAIEMFTNRDGRFAAQGLRPGAWHVEIVKGDRKLVYTITVPTDAKGLVRGGTLKPEVKP